MRRMVFLAGAAAAVAGATVLVGRSRGATSAGVPGVLPGRLRSWVYAYLNRLFHAGMARAIDLQPGDDLLDVACGAGVFLTEHASHVGRVAGVDLSEPQVGLARRRLADRIAAGTAEIKQGDAGALPWEDGRFTAVTCIGAFAFFPDAERALAEMCRVLRPGGRIVVDVCPKVPEGTESHRARGPRGPSWRWNETDVRRMTEAAGFDDVAITYVRFYGSLGSLLSRLVSVPDEETIVAAVKPA
jgi:SAM-dependent methyltransferase